MKRTFVLLLIALSLIFSSIVSAQTIELTYWTHTDDNRSEIENRYIEEFQKLYPNVTIKRVVNEAAKMGDLVLTAFSAQNAPDLFNLPIEQEYGYMIHGRVAPVNYEAAGYANAEELVANYLPGTFDPVTMDGEIYGLPLELTNWAIYINDRVFRDAGLDPDVDYPKTWEEMIEVSEKLVIREGDIIVRRGFDFRYPYYLVAMLPMVEQLGGALLSEDGRTAIVNDDAWLQVLNWFQEFGPHGRNLGSPTYTSARKIWDYDNDDMAMCLSGFYQQGRLRIDNPEFFESGEWRVIPFPVFKNAVQDVACAYYGHYLMVNAQASQEKQYWAWKFISYMLDHPWEYLETVNIIQPRNDLLEDPRFMELPYMDVFMNDMERGHIVFLHENGYQFERFIKEAVESVMLENMDTREALDILREKIQEVLDDEY
ncbi:MAG TPA: extracellular solute-binding protein [Firmicutes bacterium]|nr:extracellular solute-binding protein [Bacillota bacterium]